MSDARHEHVAIVGAGMVGLSTAWFLQRHGVEVTVLDRRGVAAGASWGNAGLLTPAFTAPLPEPGVLRYGLASFYDPRSPISIPITVDLELWGFLADFARYCTHGRWRRSAKIFDELNRLSLGAYDELTAGGIAAPVKRAEPLLVVGSSARDCAGVVEEFERMKDIGAEIDYDRIGGRELRALEPALGADARVGLRVHGQRFVNPPEFVAALADAVRQRGGDVVTGFDVVDIRQPPGSGVELVGACGRRHEADAVVLANGCWLGSSARRFGVRRRVRAGRGYSFSVRPQAMPSRPIYFPAQRVSCNPLGDRFRVTGVMEFQPAQAPLNPRRIHRIIDTVRPMLAGVDWNARRDEWVGSRPCTADGLPLVGATESPRVYVAGGHGMWGMALGPLTGRMLADAMTGHHVPEVMRHLDPLR